jgi:hypothetical protein
MMDGLLKRGRQIAEARAEALADAYLAKPLPPDISSERVGNGITLSGRGLRRRYVTDATLREAIR